ncbi:MAG: DUF4923 family protein [Bacteroides sp.]|nr:DUF4923 family protein [Roseburia sp.]MCM1345858.1 DUF4923 family protein [Bacteroides sp.]MCM1420248.1 DUF4923 family protein [Bacteroides sp.]
MKTGKTISFASILLGTSMMCSCGGSMPANSATSEQTQASAEGNGPGAILGSLLGGATGGSTEGAMNTGSLIGGIIGQLTSASSQTSIVGTWTYTEPTVQFESENLLAQAGGVVAGQAVVKKVQPYYEKAGIKAGAISFTFNEDKSCSFIINGKEHTGTYEYDNKTNVLTIKGNLGFNLATAYATISANNLAITFDSSKLMSVAQTLGAASTNTTISALSGIASSYNGMKTGFLFKKN